MRVLRDGCGLELADQLAGFAFQAVHPVGQVLQPAPARVPVVRCRDPLQGVGEVAPARQVVQGFQHAEPSASIRDDGRHAHFLPLVDLAPGLAHVVGQALFPAAQEQQAPGAHTPGHAAPRGAALLHLVAEHVDALPDDAPVSLPDLVKDQGQVAVLRRDRLQGVIGLPPLALVLVRPPHTRRDK